MTAALETDTLRIPAGPALNLCSLAQPLTNCHLRESNTSHFDHRTNPSFLIRHMEVAVRTLPERERGDTFGSGNVHECHHLARSPVLAVSMPVIFNRRKS